MNRPFLIITACAAMALLAPPPAAACGETLFRTGTGMRYHAQAQAPSARILMVADASRAQEAYRSKLYDGLRKAGHTVVEVRDTGALGDALNAGEYDLVVAHQREIDRVLAELESQPAPAAGTSPSPAPRVIPVLAKGSRPDDLGEAFRICLREGAGLGQFLRAVSQAMQVGAP